MLTLPLSTGSSINVPQGWHDITVAMYAKIQGLENEQLMSVLLDLDIAHVKRMESRDLALIVSIIQFLGVSIPYEPHLLVRPPKIETQSIAQFEQAKHYLSNYNLWDVCPNIYAIYYHPDNKPFNEDAAVRYAVDVVDNLPITAVYNQYCYLVEELNKFINKYVSLFEYKPDENEIAAGIERFAIFGWLNTLRQKCNSQPWLYEQAKQTPAGQWYMTLLMDKHEADYQHQLKELNKLTAQ